MGRESFLDGSLIIKTPDPFYLLHVPSSCQANCRGFGSIVDKNNEFETLLFSDYLPRYLLPYLNESTQPLQQIGAFSPSCQEAQT